MDGEVENKTKRVLVSREMPFLVATAKPKHKSCFRLELGSCYHLTIISSETRRIYKARICSRHSSSPLFPAATKLSLPGLSPVPVQ